MSTPMFKKLPLLSLTLGLAAFLGTQHVLARYINRGPNLDRENDSLIYISVADSLVAGDGITTFSGTFSSYWPPLYPITIALIGFGGIDSVQAGLLVNIVAFSLVIIGTGIWLHRYTGSQLLALGGAVTVGTSYTLTWLSSNVISEPLLICLTFFALAQLGRFTESGKYRQSALIWSASIAALATITRYLGITVVLTAVVVILMQARLPVFRRLKYTAIYCAISISPLALYMVRNWLHVGYPSGNRSGIAQPRYPSTLADIFTQLGEVFDLWLFSKRAPGWLGLVLVVVVGVLVIGMIRIIVNRLFSDLEPILPFVTFIVVYLIALTITLPSAPNYIYDRFASAIYVPAVGSLVVLFYHSYKSIIFGQTRVIKWVLILIIAGSGIVGWFAIVSRATSLNFNETANKVQRVTLSVKGYTRNSATVDYLINNPIDGTIYSNDAAALFGMAVLHDIAELKRVYYIHGVSYIEFDYIPEATDSRACLSWIQQVGESDERPYLVYLFEEIASESCNPMELESQSKYLELVTRTYDGVIYKVNNVNVSGSGR